jgi:hypothetical protein
MGTTSIGLFSRFAPRSQTEFGNEISYKWAVTGTQGAAALGEASG